MLSQQGLDAVGTEPAPHAHSADHTRSACAPGMAQGTVERSNSVVPQRGTASRSRLVSSERRKPVRAATSSKV